MNTAPVVIGIGDIQQKCDFENLDEALVLMNEVTQAAINDCGNKNIVNYIDEIRDSNNSHSLLQFSKLHDSTS